MRVSRGAAGLASITLLLVGTMALSTTAPSGAAGRPGSETPARSGVTPSWTTAAAHDTSPTLASIAARRGLATVRHARPTTAVPAVPAAPIVSFEGLHQTCGFSCAAPDPAGDVSRNQSVEMANYQ